MNNQRIMAVHLLNDFSGSPFVLRQSLEELVKAKYEVRLFTATPGDKGFLSNIAGVQTNAIFYRWSKNRWLTLCLFLYSQFSLFIQFLFRLRKSDIVYINSILPFGAALAAKFRGCKVLYHIHEVSVKPAMLKRFLLFIANHTASRGVFVSNDVLQRTLFKKEATVVYNSLPAAFIQEAMQQPDKKEGPFSVLMLCSLKKYKGIMEFLGCAKQLPAFRFMLVLNATDTAIKQFFAGEQLPDNLGLFPAQKNVHPFYRQADVVMNLSLPDQWIETFGMTILEAMYYKKPAIIPVTGGITELVTDEKEGFRVNPRDIHEICDLLQMMASCPSAYRRLSVNAGKKAQSFTPRVFAEGIIQSVQMLERGPEQFFNNQLSLFESVKKK